MDGRCLLYLFVADSFRRCYRSLVYLQTFPQDAEVVVTSPTVGDLHDSCSPDPCFKWMAVVSSIGSIGQFENTSDLPLRLRMRRRLSTSNRGRSGWKREMSVVISSI